MSKKNENSTEFVPELEGAEESAGTTGLTEDFSVADEYKPSPLLFKGLYNGTITDHTIDQDKQCAVIDVTLNENGSYMNDDFTPVDGVTLKYKIWFPRQGDDQEYTKTGRMTKRQAKINMLRDISNALKIDLNSAGAVNKAMFEKTWVGMSVKASVSISEYEGRLFNNVDKLIAA